MAGLPAGTVTFLFTDIEGSTTLLQRLGDRRYAEVLEEHRRLLRIAFEEGNGPEVDRQGDAFLVAFSRAREAVGAAVAAQRALMKHPWPEGASLSVRMGLHTGEPLSGTADYVGLDVHRAARICSAGHGGQILVSQAVEILATPDLPPGVSLQDLGRHRLRDLRDPEHLFQVVHADLAADFPPLKSLNARPNNLPIQLTSFIGREREKSEVRRLLSTSRCLALTGSGGAGKTRLALQVAAEALEAFPDGVWLVELAALSSPNLVPKAVASALGVSEQPGRALTEALRDALRGKSVLVVLDNCEHLVAACAYLADALLRACPNLRILTTSREALGVTGETVWRVPSLSVPDPQHLPPLDRFKEYDAVRLFIDRAMASDPQFAVTRSNAPAVAQVCHRLDGIPLAIELAAARVKVLAVEQIAARLDDRFRLLTGGSRTAVLRQQTLRATMDWSFDLLSEEERALLLRLSVFAGGWSLEAAEAVCSGNGVAASDILDLLTQLVDKSLVITETQGGEARYRLLETVRQYGWERLVESNEAADIRRRHRDWYLDLAERAEPRLLSLEQVVWLERLEAEHDNLRAALELSRAEESAEAWLRLAGALHYFWFMRTNHSEGREWLEGGLSTKGNVAAMVRAKALYGAGNLAWGGAVRDRARAEILLSESLALFRELRDISGIAYALHNLAHVAARQGDYDRATARFEESIALFREAGNKWGLGWSLQCLGHEKLREGDIGRAKALIDESLPIVREVGNRYTLAYVHHNLGRIAERQDDYERASALLEEALPLAQGVGDKDHVDDLQYDLANLSLRRGDNKRAARLHRESLISRRERGMKEELTDSLEGLGRVACAQEHYKKAALLFGAVEALRETLALHREPSDQVDYNGWVASTRGALGQKSFAAAWAEGRAMTLEQAIEYALADV
jgi:predicted ATPase/class 3 adenylate cyclase